MHAFPAHCTSRHTSAGHCHTTAPHYSCSATHLRTIDTAATLTCRTACHAACHVHRALARCPPRALARCPLAQPRPTRPPHSPRRTRRSQIAAPLAERRLACTSTVLVALERWWVVYDIPCVCAPLDQLCLDTFPIIPLGTRRVSSGNLFALWQVGRP